MWIPCSSFYSFISKTLLLVIPLRLQWSQENSILRLPPSLLYHLPSLPLPSPPFHPPSPPLPSILPPSKHLTTSPRWPSPESELRHRSWEQFHLVFLRAKLLEMLEILQEEEGQLSEEAVAALEFVFSSAVNLEPCNLLAMAISAGVQSGYSKVIKMVSLERHHHIIFYVFFTPPISGSCVSNHPPSHILFSDLQEVFSDSI